MPSQAIELEQAFLFCSCDSSDGRVDPRTRQLVNRHVQLQPPSRRLEHSARTPALPARRQIRFRVNNSKSTRPQKNLPIGNTASAKSNPEVACTVSGEAQCPRCGRERASLALDEDLRPYLSDAQISKILKGFYQGCIHMDHSPTAYRVGLAGIWSKSMFPSEEHNSPKVQMHVANWLPPRSRGQAAANDALTLLELAQLTLNDKRVAYAAAETHYRAICGLQAALRQSQQGGNLQNAKVLAHVLLMAELHSLVGPDGLRSRQWESHIRGLIAMDSVYGSDIADPTSFDNVMSRSLRLECLMGGFILRRAFPLQRPKSQKWLEPELNHLEELVELGLRIVPILEETDHIRENQSPSSNKTASVLIDALSLETRLSSWYQRYLITSTTSEYVLTDELENSLPPRTQFSSMFGTALKFNAFLDAHYHTMYWIGLLLLRESILDLKRSTANLSRDPLEDNHYAGAQTCARNLCRGVPYHVLGCADGITSKAMAAGAPLYFARRWFSRSHHLEELAWCDHVTHGMRKIAPLLNWEVVVLWHFFGLLWFTPAT